MPKHVPDLMRVTGWSKPTVLRALREGRLPGYQSGPRGHWTVTDEAFARVESGTWKPPARQQIIVRPQAKGTPA